MGRMTDRDFQIIKESFEHSHYGYSPETVRLLFAHAEAIELELKTSKEDEQRALDAMNRLMDNVAQLTNEKDGMFKEIFTMQEEVLKLRKIIRDDNRALELAKQSLRLDASRIEELESELHEAREAKKVALPKEVVEAIEWYKSHERSEGFILKLYDLGEIKRLANIKPNTRAQTITRYIFDQGYKNYFTALVNGYTVEKTKEDRLREGIENAVTDLIEKTTPPDSKELKIKMLTDVITVFVTQFNAEN